MQPHKHTCMSTDKDLNGTVHRRTDENSCRRMQQEMSFSLTHTVHSPLRVTQYVAALHSCEMRRCPVQDYYSQCMHGEALCTPGSNSEACE